MSFSAKVKRNLSDHFGCGRHCLISEIAAIINMCGHISESYVGIQTENVVVAKKYYTLIKKAFNINCEVLIRRNKQLYKNRTYIVSINGTDNVSKILMAAGIKDAEKCVRRINHIVVQSGCCRRAYIRGAFLSSGSLSDPEKNYHLEFVNSDMNHADALSNLINGLGLHSKIVMRKDSYIVYLKDGEQIVDLLNIMEAHVSLLEFENVRILKDMRNNVNRIVNCEMANLNKTVSASVKQVSDITYIQNTKGLSYLSPQLEEVASLRLLYPEISLKELGERLSPPVGKSGVNHRLRKINEIAEGLREEGIYERADIDC